MHRAPDCDRRADTRTLPRRRALRRRATAPRRARARECARRARFRGFLPGMLKNSLRSSCFFGVEYPMGFSSIGVTNERSGEGCPRRFPLSRRKRCGHRSTVGHRTASTQSPGNSLRGRRRRPAGCGLTARAHRRGPRVVKRTVAKPHEEVAPGPVGDRARRRRARGQSGDRRQLWQWHHLDRVGGPLRARTGAGPGTGKVRPHRRKGLRPGLQACNRPRWPQRRMPRAPRRRAPGNPARLPPRSGRARGHCPIRATCGATSIGPFRRC